MFLGNTNAQNHDSGTEDSVVCVRKIRAERNQSCLPDNPSKSVDLLAERFQKNPRRPFLSDLRISVESNHCSHSEGSIFIQRAQLLPVSRKKYLRTEDQKDLKTAGWMKRRGLAW